MTKTLTNRRPNERRLGFTLVELLVVITIIAILAGLIIGAATGALGRGEETRIKAQINQINGAFEDYKNTLGSYPPRTQTDENAANSSFDADYPHINDSSVLSGFKRHFKKAYPQHREPDYLIEALVGQGGSSAPNLVGGMNAAEALVFFLTKMSDDPRYPISGVGGPSYSLGTSSIANFTADAIDNRSWWLEPNIQDLGPRDPDTKYFDGADNRYLIYQDPNPEIATQIEYRQINFWYLKDPGNLGPFVYFDASRGSAATGANDVPATSMSFLKEKVIEIADSEMFNQLFDVHAIKRVSSTGTGYTFANKGKFQILHPGLDAAWGVLPMESPSNANSLISSRDYHQNGNESDTVGSQSFNLPYPDGPWTLDLADTLTNFTDSTLEDAQP